ncbi:hypothetical protein J27TS7_05960 [Paenibacillus dendritiformis]|nr:hypothetical protein [Paenibacillus dendritiformis]GIO71082.1 hypothetical protein J27TS7_05960 [Paenibacillus dendritiformis]
MKVDKEIEELKRRLTDVETQLKRRPRKGGITHSGSLSGFVG